MDAFQAILFLLLLVVGALLFPAAYDPAIRLKEWVTKKRKHSEPEWIEGFSGKKVSETEEGKLFQTVGVKDECPDCHGHGFYSGPSGGAAQNIFCKNRDCRSGFNITYFSPTQGICDRISKGDLARYPKDAA